MKSNKRKQKTLLFFLLKKYLIQCCINTLVITILMVILDIFISEFISSYWEHGFLYYRSLYLFMIAVVIWAISILICTYKLLCKVIFYLYDLQNATEQIFDKKIDYIELPPELSDIASNINRLKQISENNERLAKENEKRKNNLIMYLAHDLKTPLSSIIGYLTLLRDEQKISDELRIKYISIALDKSKRLEDLINEFFDITRFNLSDIELNLSKINLTRLFEQLIYEFRPMLKEKNLKCNLDIESDIMLQCDPDKLQRAFDNILKNAIIYCYKNTDINVSVKKAKNKLIIKIMNHGDTIPHEKLTRIFEQFYRLDSARSTNGGAGLGLAIAKKIIELHNGTIIALSENNIIEFTLTIPAL